MMCEHSVQNDLSLAQKVCEELKDGNRKAILKIHTKCHAKFYFFAKRRLKTIDSTKADDAVNDFWIELMNGSAICAYQNETAPLCLFLIKALGWRIIDNMKKIKKESSRFIHMNSGETDLTDEELFSHAALKLDQKKTVSKKNRNGINQNENLKIPIPQTPQAVTDVAETTPENELLKKEQLRIIYKTLLQLDEINSGYAAILRLYFLEGMKQHEIAEMLGIKNTTIRKQFERAKAKFKTLLEQNLKKCNISPNNFFT